MRKGLIKAFTLIELMVVISIMTLITTSSTFYFIDFVKNREVSQKLKIIDDDFQKLDQKVKKQEIFDYELILNINSMSGAYITYLNNFDIDNFQRLILNSSTGSGTISIGGISSGTGILKLYKNIKLFSNEEINKSSTKNFNFNTEKSYKIESTLSGEILNQIDIKYFSEDNLYPKKHNKLNLIAINTKEDKTGTSINKLLITNIGGNKKFYKNNTLDEITNNKIYLFFENNGIEKFIKLTK